MEKEPTTFPEMEPVPRPEILKSITGSGKGEPQTAEEIYQAILEFRKKNKKSLKK